MAQRRLDHHLELTVAFGTEADVAGIDAQLGQGGRAVRVAGEEQMAVIVEVADQGNLVTPQPEPVANPRHRLGRRVGVDRHAHDLGAGIGELDHLTGRGVDVGGVGVGHRLHDDRRVAADDDVAHAHGVRLMPRDLAQCDHARSMTVRQWQAGGRIIRRLPGDTSRAIGWLDQYVLA